MTQTPPGSDRERAELAADLKTATLSGSGLGLALLGFAIPLMSIVGVALAYFGWRSARPEYRVGRVFAILGMVAGVLGMGMLVLDIIGAG